ncbi:MAG: Cobyrinic acid ac-diamide synthase, partial [Cryobacterium sp.]|nr:Cobyrinic acid ac-diamide synthase [Cryobacterium sp.]
MSRFVLITSDADFEQRVRRAISGGLPGSIQTFRNVVLPETPSDLLKTVTGDPAEVILLGPGVDVASALRLAAIFDVQWPEIALVLVSIADPELALAAMRAGIRDILEPAADAEAIRVLLERACRSSASRRRGSDPVAEAQGGPTGQVIVVASPKGGVGKTTIATNLAVALGKLAPMSTVLVDLDAQFGDVASALQLMPEHTLTDAVSPAAAQDPMVLKAFLSVHHSSIYALCAPHSPAEADRISGENIVHLLGQLASEFRYVVVDTAPGLGEQTLAAFEAGTDAVLLCSMDVPSVRGLRKQLDILAELQLLPQRKHMVVNLAESNSGLSIRDIEATIGVPIDTVVPRSRDIMHATNAGEPLMQKVTRSP